MQAKHICIQRTHTCTHSHVHTIVESSEVVWGNNRDSVNEAKKRTAHDKLQPKTNRLCIVHVHVYVRVRMRVHVHVCAYDSQRRLPPAPMYTCRYVCVCVCMFASVLCFLGPPAARACSRARERQHRTGETPASPERGPPTCMRMRMPSSASMCSFSQTGGHLRACASVYACICAREYA